MAAGSMDSSRTHDRHRPRSFGRRIASSAPSGWSRYPVRDGESASPPVWAPASQGPAATCMHRCSFTVANGFGGRALDNVTVSQQGCLRVLAEPGLGRPLLLFLRVQEFRQDTGDTASRVLTNQVGESLLRVVSLQEVGNVYWTRGLLSPRREELPEASPPCSDRLRIGAPLGLHRCAVRTLPAEPVTGIPLGSSSGRWGEVGRPTRRIPCVQAW